MLRNGVRLALPLPDDVLADPTRDPSRIAMDGRGWRHRVNVCLHGAKAFLAVAGCKTPRMVHVDADEVAGRPTAHAVVEGLAPQWHFPCPIRRVRGHQRPALRRNTPLLGRPHPGVEVGHERALVAPGPAGAVHVLRMLAGDVAGVARHGDGRFLMALDMAGTAETFVGHGGQVQVRLPVRPLLAAKKRPGVPDVPRCGEALAAVVHRRPTNRRHGGGPPQLHIRYVGPEALRVNGVHGPRQP
mmetsp:Transcript_81016/g.234929  ORF Transcript_81016/g.234929 Transcript_81016/m.234929 type:complete len:243 (+) Transcript_81016:166-894(+)